MSYLHTLIVINYASSTSPVASIYTVFTAATNTNISSGIYTCYGLCI
ncbi:hypothetical protein SPONL_1149 [uncultured Candidatus Thioglobus sp.]|nr:hypothetical protein SPONL_1149 [uncultured Candidatus Thioglobus sp.]